MTALYRLPGAERSLVVSRRFGEVYAVADGRARVRYRKHSGPEIVECFLVGIGWNVTHSGTQEALVVRALTARFSLDMIPFTQLISIDPPTG